MNRKSLIILLLISSVALIALFFTITAVYRSAGDISPGVGIFFGKGEVGILEISGIVIRPDEILKKIRRLKKRKAVRGVVVRINSPGGSVSASQEIYEEIKKLDKIKPVVASLSSVAASGGYYIALGARSIVANPGTLTGSIGVMMQLAYLEKLYEFIKFTPVIIKSGKFKDIGASHRKIKPEERALLQNLSDNMHLQFKEAVSQSRRIPMEMMDSIADGRIFSGEQAFELGLIDHIGTFDDSITYVSNLVGIVGEPELYYPKEYRKSLKELLSGVKTFINNTLLEIHNRFPLAM